MDNPKDNASLHLWQKRNFLFQKDSKTNEKAKHFVNMAQIMSAFTADNLQKPFVNMMLENELNCCLQLNSSESKLQIYSNFYYCAFNLKYLLLKVLKISLYIY